MATTTIPKTMTIQTMTTAPDDAGVIEAAEDTKRFARAMRCGNLIAAFAFWRHVEQYRAVPLSARRGWRQQASENVNESKGETVMLLQSKLYNILTCLRYCRF